MREPRKLHDMAAAALADLRSRGIEPTDEEIVELNGIATDLVKGGTRQELARGRPVSVGGVWLWPLTLSASKWFSDTGCRILDGEFALAYAMAHGRDADLECVNPVEVLAWGWRLRCTRRELRAAVAEVLAQEERDRLPPSDDAPTHGDIVLKLMAANGGDVRQWENYVSFGCVIDLLETMAAQSEADDKGGAEKFYKRRANVAFAYCLNRIKKRAAGESEDDQDGEDLENG